MRPGYWKHNIKVLTMVLRNDQTSLLGEDEEENWPAEKQPHPPLMDRVSQQR